MKRAVDSRSDRRPFAQSLSLSVSPAQTRSTALSSAGSALDQAATSKIDNRHVWLHRMVRARNRDSEMLVLCKWSPLPGEDILNLLIATKYSRASFIAGDDSGSLRS